MYFESFLCALNDYSKYFESKMYYILKACCDYFYVTVSGVVLREFGYFCEY